MIMGNWFDRFILALEADDPASRRTEVCHAAWDRIREQAEEAKHQSASDQDEVLVNALLLVLAEGVNR